MEGGEKDGVILTTDADSQVAPNWIAPNLAVFVAGVPFVEIDNITSQIGVILQKRLGQRMILVPNAEEAAKGQRSRFSIA
jgi:hypothetical protein